MRYSLYSLFSRQSLKSPPILDLRRVLVLSSHVQMSHFMWLTATIPDGTNVHKQILGQVVLSVSMGRKKKNCHLSGHKELMEDGWAGYEH